MPNMYSAEREAALDLARPPKVVKSSETEERGHCPHQLDQLGQEEDQMLHHLSEIPFHPYENLLWHVGQHAAALDDARGNNNGESSLTCAFSLMSISTPGLSSELAARASASTVGPEI